MGRVGAKQIRRTAEGVDFADLIYAPNRFAFLNSRANKSALRTQKTRRNPRHETNYGQNLHASRNQFEWDEEKYALNLRKHGVTFEEAAEVFFDGENIFGDASRVDELREYVVGFSFSGNLLFTVFVERRERTRIVSARPATRYEAEEYDRSK